MDLAARLGIGTSQRLLGEILERSGQDDEARRSLEEAVQTLKAVVDPLKQANQERYLAQAYQTLGTAYQYLGYLDEKQSALRRKPDRLQPGDPELHRCVDLGESSSDQIYPQGDC